MGIFLLIQRNSDAPHLCALFKTECTKEIRKAFNGIHVCKHKVNGEPCLHSLRGFIKPSPDDLRLLFHLNVVETENCGGIHRDDEPIEWASFAMCLNRLKQGRPFISVTSIRLIAACGIDKDRRISNSPIAVVCGT